MHGWLHTLAIASLATAGACATVITADIAHGRRQKMPIMNLVWPLTALYGGPLALIAYVAVGRRSARAPAKPTEARAPAKPFWQSVALAATHCGSGCTLGDLVGEWFLFLVPLSVLGHHIFASWVVDYPLAFGFGIAFQYFTIRPMRKLSRRAGIIAALKADTLSLTSWQLGMYGWMAIATFAIFGREIPHSSPLFWFMMQLAMLFGFVTAYPVNWWLIRRGIKEAM